ncbi:predicted Zn-dependent protease DUF2268 [Bacillus oleivorans]|uniref:Predicted Zn-dependent protease DUF2268 n=1 Tax=Bacillus oleivorans TaxID=1448271 RepID=A0A285CXU9_9BACI|nr:DUF2268 domain-containing putative Zn-dependent protease [Bacillus oleivorans]SNX72360.1 predicted Zn-dependent protease DUF2268 [Bacillus oleivorans]
MIELKQVTPNEILSNRYRLDEYFREKFSLLVDENSWLTKWEHLVQRFQLHKFKDLSKQEISLLQWDTDQIKAKVEETVNNVNQHLIFNEIQITIVPALLLPFFKDQHQSLWTNAFTNGPGNIIIAIPPKPDIDFFQYLLAHELHHATPENPIYNLSFETFTLEEWYKMEGTAEYFSLSLYPDKRWWKDNFSNEVEVKYWSECKDYLKTTDDNIKSKLCFGSVKMGIPVFAGYSFALKLVSNFISTNQVKEIRQLFKVEPSVFIENYKRKIQ